MTRRTRTWILLLLISGCASTPPPHEAKFEVGPGPYDIDLDAAAGNYEERFLHVPNGAFTVKGSIQFLMMRADAKWASMAGIELLGPKDSYHVGLIAFEQTHDPGRIQIAVRDNLHGLPDATFAQVVFGGQSIPFELRLDKSGVLQISAAGTDRTLSVRGFEITRVRVLSSTGHFKFSDVEITASTDEAPAARSAPEIAAKAAGPATAPGFGRSSVRFDRENYPSKARREGITGRVGLECSVDAKGYVHDIVVLESGGPVLDDAARTIFSDARLLVPPDWAVTGGPTKRFRYGVIFRMAGKTEVAPFDDHRQTVVITASPLE